MSTEHHDLKASLRALRGDEAVRVASQRTTVPAASISAYETGARVPSIPALERLLDGYGVPGWQRDGYWRLHRAARLAGQAAEVVGGE